MNDDCQAALNAAFPADADAELVRAVREGVLLGDDLIEGTLFLKNAVGKNYRGLLRRAGVIYRIHSLCQTGELPFQAAMVRMERGTWHCLEMYSGTFKAHVCRTDGPNSFPEHSETRQDERLANQPDLFDNNVLMFRDLLPSVNKKYAWLTFSADKKAAIQHLCWGMPSTEGENWLAHVNVLRRAATQAEKATIQPDKKAQLRFKQHIEEALEGKDDKTQSE